MKKLMLLALLSFNVGANEKAWTVESNLTEDGRILLQIEKAPLYSCNCTSSTIDCGPYHVCESGGCDITPRGCKTGGKEPCIGHCKYVGGMPRDNDK